MMNITKTKQLMKIVIGAAWIDGIIQPAERECLKKMATEKGVMEDREIKFLLSELKPVTATECYQWLKEYLGENHDDQDYNQLLEAVSALIYSDGDVDLQEAKFLKKLQDFDPNLQSSHHHFIFEPLLKAIQKIYKKALSN